MFYQLPNGKVIELSTEQYLEMSDEELEYLIAFNYGDVVENPWHGSILTKHDKSIDDSPEILPELIDIPEIDKILDLDVDSNLEEE
jgi:hypothetical protein